MSEKTASVRAGESPAVKVGGKGLNIAIGVAAVLTLVGIGLWVMQGMGGMAQTNMRDFAPWGLHIIMFMFFVGLSTGALFVSTAPLAFGLKGFDGISKVSAWVSICCAVLAIGFVVVDLGQPARLWELFIYSNLESPLMWDIVVLGVFLILSIVYLWVLLKAEKGGVSRTAKRVVSIIALLFSVVVLAVDAWIFGLQQAHELWYTALMGPWFVSSALVSGVAVALIATVALRKVGYVEVDGEIVLKLTKVLGVFVCVDLFFLGCDLVTNAYPAGSGAEIAAMLVSGPLAPFFWIEVVGCIACAVICFVPSLRKNPLIVVGALLALAGTLCKRFQILIGGFQVPNIEMPSPITSVTFMNWQSGVGEAYQSIVYMPSMLEIGVMVGVIGLGALMLCLGLKYLPLRPVEREDS